MLLRGILDRLVLLAAVLGAACIPSFIAQYRQRLGGRLDQVMRDLAPFQEIANRNHGGDIRALIDHHLRSTDATFHAEGNAIQAMVDAAQALRAAVEGLSAGLWRQFGYLITNADPELARATWATFSPSFGLAPEALLFALAVGVSTWLLFLLAWVGCARLARRHGHGHHAAPRPVLQARKKPAA
ncbi:MAG: DUF2937 family protein [Usitatibacter sp.]